MVKRLVQSSKILDIPEKEWKRGQQWETWPESEIGLSLYIYL